MTSNMHELYKTVLVYIEIHFFLVSRMNTLIGYGTVKLGHYSVTGMEELITKAKRNTVYRAGDLNTRPPKY